MNMYFHIHRSILFVHFPQSGYKIHKTFWSLLVVLSSSRIAAPNMKVTSVARSKLSH